VRFSLLLLKKSRIMVDSGFGSGELEDQLQQIDMTEADQARIDAKKQVGDTYSYIHYSCTSNDELVCFI